MLVTRIITFAALVASAAAARLRIRGAEAPNAIENTFVFEFTPDVDATETVTQFFASKGVEANVRLTVKNDLTNSISVSLAGEYDVDLLNQIPNLNDIFAVHTVEIPEPIKQSEEVIPTGAAAPEGIHTITGVVAARAQLGLTGKGIRVAVVDSGIDYNHPALGGCFGPNCRVSFGYDLVGDNYPTSITPDSDPFDGCGASAHGTHVSGIVAGDARNITDPAWAPPFPWTGVAPEATLGHYRVFSCPAGGTATDIIAAAIYRAADDKADIINLSLGGGPVFGDWVSSVAANRVADRGVIVISANGNDGASGSFAGAAPGNAAKGFGIASFDNVETPLRSPPLTVSTSSTSVEVVVADVNAEATNKQNDGSGACPATPAALAGKALLIRWGPNGGLGSASRCEWAATCGAAFCLLYSDNESLFGIAGATRIPSLIAPNAFGRRILAAVSAGTVPRVTVKNDLRNFGVPTAGTVSSFSSPGLDQELLIKPDLGGIGGLVYSTVTKFVQNVPSAPLRFPYNVNSGTSMASPYVAGVAALVLQAYGRDRPSFEEVLTILQNSAVPQKKFGTNLIDSVAYQGAGLVNALNALTIKTVVTPSGSTPVTYIASHQPALMVSPFVSNDDMMQVASSQRYTPDYATVLFSRNSALVPTLEFTLAPGASRTVRAHVTAPSTAIAGTFPIYSGYIFFTVKGEDSKAVSVLTPPSTPNSALSPLFTRIGVNVAPANATFATGVYTPPTPSNPSPLVSPSTSPTPPPLLDPPIAATNTRIARVEVFYRGSNWTALEPLGIKRESKLIAFADNSILLNPDAATGQLTQGGGARLFFSSGLPVLPRPRWRGRVIADVNNPAAQLVSLPAGPYQIRITALKFFGRVNSPIGGNDWDSVTSPVFNIVY
ncbi:peptidase S8/S53 domain-containing protein [Chytridium lagenaria]|nr:peptidase S8/S53 domain-containing protein [Chytridium lagenaria]